MDMRQPYHAADQAPGRFVSGGTGLPPYADVVSTWGSLPTTSPAATSPGTGVPGMDATPRLEIQHHPGYSLVTLRGEFDVASRDVLREELEDALNTGPGDTLLIDLSGVGFLDCT